MNNTVLEAENTKKENIIFISEAYEKFMKTLRNSWTSADSIQCPRAALFTQEGAESKWNKSRVMEREIKLAKVEELLQDDYGMSDGIINNGDKAKEDMKDRKQKKWKLSKSYRCGTGLAKVRFCIGIFCLCELKKYFIPQV